MLDLTTKSAASTFLISNKKPLGRMFSDLRNHVAKRDNLTRSTRAKWLRVIDRVAKVQNRPLAQIPATLEHFEATFPPTWSNAAVWKSTRAYKDFRGILQSALREFTGVHAKRDELRKRDDSWAQLLAAVTLLTAGKLGNSEMAPRWHPMKLVGLKSLAREARDLNIQPLALNAETGNEIASAATGNLRSTIVRALRRFDELFAFGELNKMLPAEPICFSDGRLVPLVKKLPDDWEALLSEWALGATQKNWDPIVEEFSDKHEKHAHVIRSAVRTFARVALDLHLIEPSGKLRILLADNSVMTAVAREMFARKDLAKNRGRLQPRTSRKYLKCLRQIRAHLGIEVGLIEDILKNNLVARQGRKDDKEMTPANRKFCEDLVGNPALRRRFFCAHLALQAEARRVIEAARNSNRNLSNQELAQVRMLGAIACFAAIEIGGAPVRLKNALQLTCVGQEAHIQISTERKRAIAVFIPANLTKNRKSIEFQIQPSKHHFYEVVRWYMDEIRGYFPNAQKSQYLFPSLKNADGHLSSGHFRSQFQSLMRRVANVPMSPHQMRHGQTSLLLNKYPEALEIIAIRINDHPQTLRNYYGWLNSLRLVEHGQNLLAGLIDE
ncbi:MAG: tyrosine-type recombinase/integrase [Sulfitobacter sp.]|nr:tyrosine-type recombinase/integrase [Sulfitobacter sp.]